MRRILWQRASKPAEMTAMLIAMAQQQFKLLGTDLHAENSCCSDAICESPFLKPLILHQSIRCPLTSYTFSQFLYGLRIPSPVLSGVTYPDRILML